MSETGSTLDRLRTAPRLVYETFTVIEATGGVDGALRDADDRTVSFWLDLFTPAERQPGSRTHGEHVIEVDSEKMSRQIARDTVTAWCREHLGRDDVTFELD